MDKPKKPMSGFLRFLKEEYARKPRPAETNFRDYHKQIVQAWYDLSDEQKKVYNDACLAESAGYKRDLAKWELKMIRLGNIELVRHQALIEGAPPKTMKPYGRPTTHKD